MKASTQYITIPEVTPYGGVWIEISGDINTMVDPLVTPYGGVWIEMLIQVGQLLFDLSRLMGACGLK